MNKNPALLSPHPLAKQLIFAIFTCLLVAIAIFFVSILIISKYSTEGLFTSMWSSISDSWGFILGLPITAAGTVLALILAKRSLDMSLSQVEQGEETLRLSSKSRELDISSVVEQRWEDSYAHCLDIIKSIEILSESCTKLFGWHRKKINYLAYGSTFAGIYGEEKLNNLRELLKSTPKEEREELLNLFRLDDFSVLDISNEKMKTEADKDLYLFLSICFIDIRNALENLAQSLNNASDDPMFQYLWSSRFKRIFDGSHNNTNYSRSEWFSRESEESKLPFKISYATIFGVDFSYPEKMAKHFNTLSELFKPDNVFISSYWRTLFLVSQDKNINPLSILFVNYDIAKSHNYNQISTNDVENWYNSYIYASEHLIFRGLPNGAQAENCYLHNDYNGLGYYLIYDLVSLLPESKDLTYYIETNFELSNERAMYIAKSIYRGYESKINAINGLVPRYSAFDRDGSHNFRCIVPIAEDSTEITRPFSEYSYGLNSRGILTNTDDTMYEYIDILVDKYERREKKILDLRKLSKVLNVKS